ncbi:hypothetical protein [Leptospira adleri]|uniref:Tetratricopeptide repeat protein n=1 Tax=Leptospira adleri TaxID=2023186 RepID=A0A2M9YP58_9LEPT|nr:hypothetical protein [Leptospira adleri]PJZ53324.1 hypothetical protein CH380_11005 [Leptospira adleri]PJZ63868.1 hypothetical protein CH376_00105 [Leptospira adleri]
MNFLIVFVMMFFSNAERNLYATPDSDFIPVAGYENNQDAMRLRKFAKNSRRVGVRIVLKGYAKSEESSQKNAILETFRENSYFILNDLSERKKRRNRDGGHRLGSNQSLQENLLMTLSLDKSRPENGLTMKAIRMEWLNRKTKERIYFQTDFLFENGSAKDIQKMLYIWKSKILPKLDVFFIADVRCVSYYPKMTRFLEIGCGNLTQKEQDPDFAAEYWEKAEQISANDYDRESIQNNLAYYYISIGDFKKAEECFRNADALDVSESYRSHRYQLEDIRAFREKYGYYEEEDSR